MISNRWFSVKNRILVILLGLACGSFSPSQAGDPAENRASLLATKQREVKWALRGAWQRIAGAKDPAANPSPATPSQGGLLWTFGDEFVTTEDKSKPNDKRTTKYRYQVNPLRQPAELTMHNEQGLELCIFRLENDTLTVASAGLGALDRPMGFTQATSGDLTAPLMTLTFQRVREKVEPKGEWATRAVQALVAENPAALGNLAREYQNLPIEARRQLPLIVRDRAVEFSFQGTMDGPSSLAFMEYLISGPERGYESMMVVARTELDRLAALRPFFVKHAGKDRGRRWDAQLAWVEGGKPRVGALADILAKVSPTDRELFLNGQEIDDQGYFGCEHTTGQNVPCDLAFVPQAAQPVTLRLTLYHAPKP